MFLFLICLGVLLSGQDYALAEIEVTEEDRVLSAPFAGGLIAPQFNRVDLNMDGLDDWLIFDRDGAIFLPMLQEAGGSYQFDPSYREGLPAVQSWVLLRDYNGDGVEDMFCSPINIGIPGIEVYRGARTEGGLTFTLDTFPERDFDILYFPVGNSVSQVFVSPVDLPDIKDVDGDGDLDILSFEPLGSKIYFYRNMSVEEGYGLDTLIYVLGDPCYGGVIESGFSQDLRLSSEAGACANFVGSPEDRTATNRHAGSTVMSMDLFDNGLQDLLIGDISYDGLVMLKNTGSSELTHFTEQEIRFPEGMDSLDLELFISAFEYEENGKKHIIACSNDRFSGQTVDHIWQYQVGTDVPLPDAVLKSKNYLVDQMIHTGRNSVPILKDINGDGLIDMLVGTRGVTSDGIESLPRILYYENVGQVDLPAYTLADDDYLGMASYRTTSRHFTPAIGDLDGDGDDDVVIGDERGKLYYVENIAESGSMAQYAVPVYEAWGIDVSAWAIPEIYDVNGDGLQDLIIGEQNFNSLGGARTSINYFQNIGEVGTPMFDPDETVSPNNPGLGWIDLKRPGFISNYSAPRVVETAEGDVLLTGMASGRIEMYPLDQLLEGDTLLSDTPLEVSDLYEGEQSTVSMADVDGDGYLEMAIGSRRGGVTIYDTDILAKVSTSTNEVVQAKALVIHPSLAQSIINISIESHDGGKLIIYNSTGTLMYQEKVHRANQKHDVNVGAWPSGTYYAKWYANEKREVAVAKFIVI